MTAAAHPTEDPAWWRSAVVYQVYIRSFADGSGDGIGDIAGLRSRLGYLADLGVDAIWINPWYPSPQRDGGYDVERYDDIEPTFGTLTEAECLITEAHSLGLRVFLDVVPNHASSDHAWFQHALGNPADLAARDRFVFRPGTGDSGSNPPNDWQSIFGGPAWTRTPLADGTPGDWYLHLFDASQPDWNWLNADVARSFDDALRFWFDRGVDGFRVDVAHGLFKAEGLPDVADKRWERGAASATVDHPMWDRPELHAHYRRWRALADSYDPPRVFVAEAYVPDPSRLVQYLRPDELHTAFNFEYLVAPWNATELRSSIDATLAAHERVGAPPTWVQSNHDLMRPVSRFGRADQTRRRTSLSDFAGEQVDVELGSRRARAACLLTLALPGGAYIYQGEELGLTEVEDLPAAVKRDPSFFRTRGADPGRDGCRVPMPWFGDAPPFGFGPEGVEPWLPQPRDWARLTAAAQADDAHSMLHLVRRALRIRRAHPALGDGTLTWLDIDRDVVAFTRRPGFACVANLGRQAITLPAGAMVIVSSDVDANNSRVQQQMIQPDTTVWCDYDSRC